MARTAIVAIEIQRTTPAMRVDLGRKGTMA
jgi:hypothetical protein